jgi:hypothetical protein
MIVRARYLPLTLLAACTEPSGTPLAELSSPELRITAGPIFVEVELRYKQTQTGMIQDCAVLADDFAATVNGKEMTITERGGPGVPALADEVCTWPVLRLDHPAAAAQTKLVLRDPSRMITADLADLLAPRSAQLVPDGPWTFTPGQAVTLQWSPASDLARYWPYPAFVYDDPSRGGTVLAPTLATLDGDRITVRMPDVAISGGTLQVTLFLNPPGRGIDPPPPCTGATCILLKMPQFAHLIDSH